MIDVRDVSKVFNAGRSNEYYAVRNMTLTIESNKITVITGPSGSGKTTLLGIIGCMSRPTCGRIYVNDMEVSSLSERFLASVRRKTFGFVFQHFNLVKGLTALENVMLPAYPLGVKYHDLKEKALQIMRNLDVEKRAQSHVEFLSGGEAQRIAISRALINDPDIIIADEPTAHLDTELTLEFLKIIRNLKQNGKTVLMSSHDPAVAESEFTDKVIALRDGYIYKTENRN